MRGGEREDGEGLDSMEAPPPGPPPLNDDESVATGSAVTRRGAYAALSYMACAVLMMMFNKAALTSYNFPYSSVLVLFQVMVSTAILYCLRHWDIISFTSSDPWTLLENQTNSVTSEKLLQTMPLSFTYLFYMLTSMESVRGVNVPVYTSLRRTTVFFTMIMEYLLTRQRYSPSIVACVVLIVLGAVVAGARDLSYDTYSYSIVFLANITTAIYLATISRLGKSSGINIFGLMWCNGLICGPLLFLWTLIGGDLRRTMNFPYLYFPDFQAILLFSCILAFLLNYTVFLNTTLNSALTQTICSNLKDLFIVAVGWLTFHGLSFDLLNIVGQGAGFLGSGLYAYCKLKGK